MRRRRGHHIDFTARANQGSRIVLIFPESNQIVTDSRVASLLTPIIDADVAETVASLLRRLGGCGTFGCVVILLVTDETGEMAQVLATPAGRTSSAVASCVIRIDAGGLRLD